MKRTAKIKKYTKLLKSAAFAVVLVAVSLISVYVYQQRNIRVFENLGPAMEPTIQSKQIVKVDTSIEPKRNDIIVYNKDFGYEERAQIKRLVGMPGDTVDLTDDVLTIYSGDDILQPFNTPVPGVNKRTVLKQYEFYVVGDNASNSLDSREYGPILVSDVIGVVIE